jgi:hypothetical protein
MRPQVDVWNVSSSHQLLQLEQIAVIAEIGGGLGAQPNNILDPSILPWHFVRPGTSPPLHVEQRSQGVDAEVGPALARTIFRLRMHSPASSPLAQTRPSCALHCSESRKRPKDALSKKCGFYKKVTVNVLVFSVATSDRVVQSITPLVKRHNLLPLRAHWSESRCAGKRARLSG